MRIVKNPETLGVVKAAEEWLASVERLGVATGLTGESHVRALLGERVRWVLLEALYEARLTKLSVAVRRYVEYHGQSADHHRDDCPLDGGCDACQVDAALGAALRDEPVVEPVGGGS